MIHAHVVIRGLPSLIDARLDSIDDLGRLFGDAETVDLVVESSPGGRRVPGTMRVRPRDVSAVIIETEKLVEANGQADG